MLLERSYNLTVGTPPVTTFTSEQYSEQEIFGIIDIPVAEDFRTVTLNAVEISDLDIEVSVTSNTKSGSSTVISIYNLSSKTRDIVEKINNYVILEAGFVEDPELKTIFTGQVQKLSTGRKGQDLVTTLYCSDGYVPNNILRVNKTFPAGVSADKIIKYIIDQYGNAGVPLGDYVSNVPTVLRYEYLQVRSPDTLTFETGYSLSGYLKDELTELVKSIGYTSYITNNRLFVHPVSYTRTVEQFEYYSDQLYSVKRSGKSGANSSSKQDIGVDISLPLDGRLDIDKQVKILDGDFSGTYRIMSRSFNIDYRQGFFDTKITCKSVDI